MEENTNKGYCTRKKENSPDCAACSEFSMDDVRDELSSSTIEFSSICFRIFNRDPQTRDEWRRKVCKHYAEEPPA